MKKIYTLITAILLCFSANAQTYQWAGALNGANNYSNALTVDGNGDVILTGRFSNTIDFDLGVGVSNITATVSNSVYIAKYSPTGAFIWVKQIGGGSNTNCTDVKCDISNNIYITGSYAGTVDFDPGIGVANGTSNGSSTSSYVAKYTSTGNYVWHKYQTCGNGNSIEVATGNQIALDEPNNRVIVAFYMNNADPFASTWNPQSPCNFINVALGSTIGIEGRFNMTTGACIIVGNQDENIFSIKVNSANNYYVFAGYQSSYPQIRIQKNNLTTFITIWAAQVGMGGPSDAMDATDIHIDSQENIILTGFFKGTGNFDPNGSYNMTSTTNGDIFILKLDPNGNFLWAKQIGGTGTANRCNSSMLDVNNNITIGGTINGTVDFDPGIGTANLSATSTDGFIAKYDSNGNYLWAFLLNSTGTQANVNDLAKNAADDIFASGRFQSTVDFDPSGNTANVTAAGGQNSFVAKYSPCSVAPTQPGTISGPTTVCNGATNTYSITAVSGATSYTWVLPGGWTGTSTTNSISATASATSGTISVTANNACGSSTAQTLVVSVNNVNASLTPTNILCNGNCNGSLISSPTGTGPFTYAWNNSQTAQTATGLCAGSYTVIVTGAGGCTASANATITQPTVLSATTSSTFITCGTCCDGTASANATGGTPTYTYVWSPSGGNASTATGLCNGTYTVCITDANGCTTCQVQNVSFNVSNQQLTTDNEQLFSIYPNPFSENVNVKANVNGDMKIYNLIGENVFNKNVVIGNNEIDLSNLESGIYFMKITTNRGMVIKKILKK